MSINTIYFDTSSDGPVDAYVEVSATGDITTTSATDVLMTTMTTTPSAGIYQVIFSTSIINDANGGITYVSIYVGGAQLAHTERRATSYIQGVVVGNQPNQTMLATNGIASVNGAQAIEIRWRRSAGTSTAHQRTLNLVKVG